MIKLREHLRISLDVDGVLADFETAYLKRFKKWPNKDWAITRNVANILIHERDFWLNLPVLNKVEFTPRLYCSARVNPKRWSKQYLRNNGFPETLYGSYGRNKRRKYVYIPRFYYFFNKKKQRIC